MADDPGYRLLDGAFYAGDPYPAYAWLRRNAPVYWDAEGEIWALTRHADVMAASKDTATFSSAIHGSRPDAPPLPSMINSDNPLHNRKRALVSRGFTPRRVAAHEAWIRGIVRDLLDAVSPLGGCDFVESIAAPLPMIVIGEMLGVEPGDRRTLQRWADAMIETTRADPPADVAERAAQCFGEYADYNRRVVADRRANPRDDLISALVHAEIDGRRLSDEELVHESLLLLVGGNETTRNVLSGGTVALSEHPEQRARLAADPSEIPLAVEECLRWVTPISNMNRTATRDVTLRGERIRKGDKVLLLYAAANRDEAVFEAPERFDVARSPNEHVAFGGFGAHFCLGASLARLELRVAFEEILRRLPDLRVAEGAYVPITPSNFIRGIRRLPVVFEARPAGGAGGSA